jgi:hypothetical protein
LVPDDAFVVDGPRQGGAKVRAAYGARGDFAFVYTPRGRPFTVRMSVIAARRVRATWFDPRYGTALPVHTGDNAGFQTFAPPSSGRGCDWVLVLDDAGQAFPSLGGASPHTG